MTKAELIVLVSKNNPKLSKRAVEAVVDAAFDEIAKSIRKQKRFSFPGFGTFSVRKRKARKGRNPQTGQEIEIPASRTVGFKPSPTLKKGL